MALIGRKCIAQIHLSSEQPDVLTDYVVVCLDKEDIHIASLITRQSDLKQIQPFLLMISSIVIVKN